jgi:nucleoside 2-deoxyribosyltransferase
MKFYIASKLENAESVKALANVLKTFHWEQTYDWTIHGSVKGEGKQRLKEVATNEMQGVREADVVIILMPGGRGTHAELGAANALWKQVFIWSETDELFQTDDKTCAFYWNHNVTRVCGDKFKLLEELFKFAINSEECTP